MALNNSTNIMSDTESVEKPQILDSCDEQAEISRLAHLTETDKNFFKCPEKSPSKIETIVKYECLRELPMNPTQAIVMEALNSAKNVLSMVTQDQQI
jgi:hypothetical protein